MKPLYSHTVLSHSKFWKNSDYREVVTIERQNSLCLLSKLTWRRVWLKGEFSYDVTINRQTIERYIDCSWQLLMHFSWMVAWLVLYVHFHFKINIWLVVADMVVTLLVQPLESQLPCGNCFMRSQWIDLYKALWNDSMQKLHV